LREAALRSPEKMDKKVDIGFLGNFSISYGPNIFLAGPVLGAPMAVIALEILIGGGAEEVLFLGFAGSLGEELSPGDYFFPSEALSSEGTSAHYGGFRRPDDKFYKKQKYYFSIINIGLFKTGLVWTTDAPYRETREIRDRFRDQGAMAVEMEAAALFSAAHYRRISLSSMLLISDTFGEGTWREGFQDEKFKMALENIGELSWMIFK
jgi:uridine phosphorylase